MWEHSEYFKKLQIWYKNDTKSILETVGINQFIWCHFYTNLVLDWSKFYTKCNTNLVFCCCIRDALMQLVAIFFKLLESSSRSWTCTIFAVFYLFLGIGQEVCHPQLGLTTELRFIILLVIHSFHPYSRRWKSA